MSNPFVFLVIPVAIITVASVVMWLRGRHPTTLRSGIDGFSREMQALSPDDSHRKPRRFEARGLDQSTTTSPTASSDQDG